MELAHARNDGLAGFFVGLDAERRIFLCQAVQGDAHLFLVSLGLRLDSLRNHRLREHHAFQDDDVVRIAQRIARGGFFQANRGGDVACQHFLDFFALVGVHLQNPAQAFLLALDRVVDGVARIDLARVDAEEDQLADERVGHDLERQSGELFVVRGTARRFLVVVVHAGDRRDVDRRRQEVDHGVQHTLHALVLERGAAQHRLDFAGDGTVTQALDDLGFGQFALFQILVHQLFVRLGSCLDHLLAPFVARVGQFSRDVHVVELGALAGLVPDDRLHLDQVDHTLEGVFGADGHNDGNRAGLQAGLQLVVDLEEVRAGTVHLVDEGQARHAVLVSLAPDGFRLGLHATHCAVDHACAIQHAHGALHLNGEVHVARGVDDVDAVFRVIAGHALPEGGGGSGGDRDATLLFLLHPVHRGGAIMHFTDLVVHTGVEQDTLGRGGFTRVNVSRDTDIAVALNGSLTSHFNPLFVRETPASHCQRP